TGTALSLCLGDAKMNVPFLEAIRPMLVEGSTCLALSFTVLMHRLVFNATSETTTEISGSFASRLSIVPYLAPGEKWLCAGSDATSTRMCASILRQKFFIAAI